ncbi:hypothetical protein SAMN05444487_11835 [Marininema mesophilum]|uniref:Uncharacterized protein n=1 Tax=Marininema mesophilum TaxID=1048340 RepID=A0A1H3BVS5_9BACL|nr:hypothetical protein [Marininema mesophilum]SDX45454.1 hypothetical protein SAMN05444487_11835 [Marininema mesophilum]
MSVHVNLDSTGVFYTVGISEEFDYKHYSLILETNVVIMLRDFYYKPHKMPSKKRSAVIELLLRNMGSDYVPGFGIFEASYHPLPYIRTAREEVYTQALKNLFAWEPEKIIRHATTTGEKLKNQPPKTPLNTKNTFLPMIKLNPMMASSYVSLLKIHSLNKGSSKTKRKDRSKLHLYEEFMNFQNEEIHIINGMESQLAFYYFLGSDSEKNTVSKFLKLGSPNINNISSACWDLFFLRLIQHNIHNGMEGIKDPKLVTSDKPLAEFFASNSSLKAIIDFGSSKVPFVIYSHEKKLDQETKNKLQEIQNKILLDIPKRFIKHKDDDTYDNIINKISELEHELTK